MRLRLGSVCLMAVLALGVGCEHMEQFNTSVTMDDKLKGGTTRVNIVGVQEEELENFKTYDVDRWFSMGDKLREKCEQEKVVYQMIFGPDTPNPQVLKENDPVWKAWKNRQVRYMVVFANLPSSDKSGNDTRKKILPLSNKRWNGPDVVSVDISEGSFMVNPPPEKGE